MDKFTLSGGRPVKSFEDHIANLNEPLKSTMLDLRDFIKSLGDNVIEEIRPHRIAYAKTLNFRTFLDIEPAHHSLVITIRRGRDTSPSIYTIKEDMEIERYNIKNQISDAYAKI